MPRRSGIYRKAAGAQDPASRESRHVLECEKTNRLNEEYNGRLFFLQNNFAVYKDHALVGTKGYTFEGPFYLDRRGNGTPAGIVPCGRGSRIP